MKGISETFKALGDPTRLEIVRLLAGKEMCVCDIINSFKVSQPTVSHHLRVLKQADIVTDKKEGKWIYYRLNNEALAAVELFCRPLISGGKVERIQTCSEEDFKEERIVKVEIFDPPMCCPTGVCGASVDPALLAVQEAVLALKKNGVTVERYSLSHQIEQFMRNEAVAALLNEKGLEVLPVTMVNGAVFSTGRYPSFEELSAALK